MKTHPFFLLILIVLLIGTFALPAAAQGPMPDTPVAQPPPVDAVPPSPDTVPQQAPDGHWFMPAGSQPEAYAAARRWTAAGRTTSDTRGTTGNPSTGSTPAVEPTPASTTPPIVPGRSISASRSSFTRTRRTQVYISRFGFLAFNSDNLWNSQSRVPSPEKPDEVIAPHWVPLSEVAGYVRYLRGGTAPNRWFAVEWNRVRGDCCNDDGAEEYTFETILHESGDIVFQYGTMTTNGSYLVPGIGHRG